MAAPTTTGVSVISFWLVDPTSTSSPTTVQSPPPTTLSTSIVSISPLPATISSSSTAATAPTPFPKPITTPSSSSFLSTKSGIAFIITIIAVAVLFGFLAAACRGDRKLKTIFWKEFYKAPRETKGKGKGKVRPLGMMVVPVPAVPSDSGAAVVQEDRKGREWEGDYRMAEDVRWMEERGRQRECVRGLDGCGTGRIGGRIGGRMEEDVRREFGRWR